MSQKRGATDNSTAENRSNSAKRGKEGSTTNTTGASAPGGSTTLTGTGAAAIASPNAYQNPTSSNIPMAEPSTDINRSERLFPPPADTSVRKSSKNTTQNTRKAGTQESRLDYAVSLTLFLK